MAGINIATYNVRGLVNNKKRREIFYFLHREPFDVIFLQETHSSKNTINRWRTEWRADIYASHGTTNSKGVEILIKKNAGIKVLSQKSDKNWLFIILKCKISNNVYLLVNVYGPNMDNPIFFSNFTEVIDEMGVDLKIIAGDFNLVLNPSVDKKGGIPVMHGNAKENLRSYMDQNSLLDIWREYNPGEFKFTWKRIHPSPIFVRLDFFLVTDLIAQTCTDCGILPGFQTHHSIPFLNIIFSESSNGLGFWKFNTSHLQDVNFVEQLGQVIDIELTQNYKDLKPKWELIKLAIRNFTLKFSARKKKAMEN